jgi:hypothetical protein
MDGINVSKKASVQDFVKNAARALNSEGDVTQRTFGGSVVLFWFYEKHDTHAWNHSLSRENGRFRDADLAKILQNATAAPASAFKARGTPEVLRVIEILSIEQGRKWGVCTVSLSHVGTICEVYATAIVERVPRVHGLET